MKTKIILSACMAFLSVSPLFAQDRTTVNAMSSEISDNLDLRAIASIFGSATNLEDFERQLNDSKIQISNLDLNEDNQVDYLRVIESVEQNTHLIIVQAVLGRDTFQDVATIEVEKDANNQVQVQVVGDVYMYGHNYIYEPVYVNAPVIYTTFWAPRYRPYCSGWYWNYYPTYYYAWNPFPVFRYRHHIGIHINFNNHYNYVNTRRCARAVVMHQPIRANYCERTYPTRAFTYRNNSYANRYELDRTRTIKNVSSRNDLAFNTTRFNGSANDPIRQSTKTGAPYSNTRNNATSYEPIRQSTRTDAPYNNTKSTTRVNEPIKQSIRTDVPYQNTKATTTVTAPIRQNTKMDTPYNNIRSTSVEPIKQSTIEGAPYNNTRSASINEPIRQSTKTDAPYKNIRSNSRVNDPIRQTTTTKNTSRYDRSDSNVKPSHNYDGSNTRESVAASRSESRNNTRVNTSARVEKSSNERTGRK